MKLLIWFLKKLPRAWRTAVFEALKPPRKTPMDRNPDGWNPLPGRFD
jgi:hypothetical protein